MTTWTGVDDPDRPPCATDGCAEGATLFVFDAAAGAWRPRCRPHAEQLHPSLEVHAWQAAGWLKPVELGRPEEIPSTPGSTRAEQFRREIRRAMGWSE